MANKLRDLFGDESQELTGKVSFDSPEHYNNFLEAVRKATEEGEPSSVKGVSGISVAYKDGNSQYPIDEHKDVFDFMVFPCETLVDINVETDRGNRNIKFLRKDLKDKFVLRNTEGKGASYEITYDSKDKKVSLNYKAKYDDAENLEEVIDYYNTLYYFTRMMFRNDVQNEEVDNVLNHFLSSIIFFDRLNKLADLLHIDISPKQIADIDNDEWFIDRAYFSLVEKTIIRSNHKVNSMNNVHFSSENLPGDNPMIVTYLEQGRLSLLGEERDVYVVNMAFNLIVEKEEKDENGDSKLYFKEDENNPMFISSKMFLEEELAEAELKSALDAKAPYSEAKTLFEYIKEAHELLAEQKKN